jgi:hypothetical protein
MIFVLLFTDTGGLVPEEAQVLRLALFSRGPIHQVVAPSTPSVPEQLTCIG